MFYLMQRSRIVLIFHEKICNIIVAEGLFKGKEPLRKDFYIICLKVLS